MLPGRVRLVNPTGRLLPNWVARLRGHLGFCAPPNPNRYPHGKRHLDLSLQATYRFGISVQALPSARNPPLGSTDGSRGSHRTQEKEVRASKNLGILLPHSGELSWQSYSWIDSNLFLGF